MGSAHKATENPQEDENVAQLQHFDGTQVAGHTHYFLN
tara:strand:- start:380 stop:493 length:114 start_codon:yes stop_codon:yes gene_type:complete